MSLICLTAGGTGGHLFPAAALSAELTARGHATHLLTDTRGLKYAGGFGDTPRTEISSGSIVGAGIRKKLASGLAMLNGIRQARKALKALKPDVLVGFGGYPSFPPMIAAWTLGIPSVLHEQNAVMGLANRHVSRVAKAVALSFDPTEGQSKPEKAVHLGNPVRQDIANLPRYDQPKDTLNILVFGGSLGAAVMADLVPEAIAALPSPMRGKINLTMQIRGEDQDRVRDTLKTAGLASLQILDFLDPMAAYLGAAHLVICRSGATTVAEIAAAGRPAIFIPLDLHADGHQAANAHRLESAKAAILTEQLSLTAQDMTQHLRKLFDAPAILDTMARAARALAKPDAASDLADLALKTRKTAS